MPGSLYRLSPDGAVTELLGGVVLSNGLDWTDDRRVFYYADSLAGGVDMFATDPDTGMLSGRRRFAEVSGGMPDGLTLDAEGCLWLAVWGSGELRRYTPDGRLDTVVKLPVSQVSSAAFGGADLSTLTSPPPGRTSRPPTCASSRTRETSSPAPPASPAGHPSSSTASPGDGQGDG